MPNSSEITQLYTNIQRTSVTQKYVGCVISSEVERGWHKSKLTQQANSEPLLSLVLVFFNSKFIMYQGTFSTFQNGEANRIWNLQKFVSIIHVSCYTSSMFYMYLLYPCNDDNDSRTKMRTSQAHHKNLKHVSCLASHVLYTNVVFALRSLQENTPGRGGGEVLTYTGDTGMCRLKDPLFQSRSIGMQFRYQRPVTCGACSASNCLAVQS